SRVKNRDGKSSETLLGPNGKTDYKRLSINTISTKGRPKKSRDASYAQEFAAAMGKTPELMKQKGIEATFQVLRNSNCDVTLEISLGKGSPKQQNEIVRAMEGQDGMHMILYSVMKSRMSSLDHAEAMRILDSAKMMTPKEGEKLINGQPH